MTRGNGPAPIAGDRYSHDLLLHADDTELVTATRAFVERGLAGGGPVMVHGTEDRVTMLRDALGSHPGLEYCLNRDLYQSPSQTLFAYERELMSRPDRFELWATGTTPLGDDRHPHPAWARYESLVNEALGDCAFHALCTYDTREVPASGIAAARATHPWLSADGGHTLSPDYLDPAEFLTTSMAGPPAAPRARPALVTALLGTRDLRPARRVVGRVAVSSSAVPRVTVESFVAALHEVLVNGLEHGRPPVELTVWAEPLRLTGRVTDAGPGIPDCLTGYRYPESAGPKGLWVARQMCEEIAVSNQPGGGCTVLVTTA